MTGQTDIIVHSSLPQTFRKSFSAEHLVILRRTYVLHLFPFARLESQSFPEKQRQYVHQLCKVTAHEFLPYINRCLEAVFQPKAIAEVLGKPSHSTDFSDSGGDNCTLEINKLARVLGEFLPNEATDQGVVTDFKPNTTDIDLKSKESLDTQNELDVQNTKLRTEVISDSSDSNQTNRKISVEP